MKLTRTDTFIIGFFLGGALIAGMFSFYFIGEKVGMEKGAYLV